MNRILAVLALVMVVSSLSFGDNYLPLPKNTQISGLTPEEQEIADCRGKGGSYGCTDSPDICSCTPARTEINGCPVAKAEYENNPRNDYEYDCIETYEIDCVNRKKNCLKKYGFDLCQEDYKTCIEGTHSYCDKCGSKNFPQDR